MYQDCTTLFHPMHLAKMLYEANDRVPAFSNPTFWRLCLPTWDKLSKRVGLKCLISSIFISHIVVLCCSANFYICLPSSMNSSIWLAIQLFRHVCAHLWPKCELSAVDTRVSDADLDKADLTGCIKNFANWYATSTFAKSRSGKEESWKINIVRLRSGQSIWNATLQCSRMLQVSDGIRGSHFGMPPVAEAWLPWGGVGPNRRSWSKCWRPGMMSFSESFWNSGNND